MYHNISKIIGMVGGMVGGMVEGTISFYLTTLGFLVRH
jgi:phage-related minor tail protein